MFIECQDGSYLNTDKVIAYGVYEDGVSVMAYIGNDEIWILGVYKDEKRVFDEADALVQWIRSTTCLEASSKEFLSKFIYRMPKE